MQEISQSMEEIEVKPQNQQKCFAIKSENLQDSDGETDDVFINPEINQNEETPVDNTHNDNPMSTPTYEYSIPPETSTTFANDELKKCKGRLDAFGNELKLLCAQLGIVTGWIHKRFGIKLINNESLVFNHIFDFEEIEELSAALSSISTNVQGRKKGRPPVGSTVINRSTTKPSSGRKRGRPSRKSLEILGKSHEVPMNDPQILQTEPEPSCSLALKPTGKRGRPKINGDKDHGNEDYLINPQDFLETIYDEKSSTKSQESSARPKRSSRKKVDYKEDKGLEISETCLTKFGGLADQELKEIRGNHSVAAEDSDISTGDKDLVKIKKERVSKRKKTINSKTKESNKTDNENDDEDKDDDDSESQTEEGHPSKNNSRKRYPKKPGVVWNSSLPKQCDECGKVLKGTSTLKLHKMMHADERPHACEICGNKFRFRRNLKVHMMAIHTGERPLQCSFCGRKFYAPKDLRIHERTHTGEKPYPCTLCTKRFNVKEHLTMHMRVHTGERPYKCPICEKAFSQANSLRIHKKIHTRDKEPTPRKPRKSKNPGGKSIPTIPAKKNVPIVPTPANNTPTSSYDLPRKNPDPVTITNEANIDRSNSVNVSPNRLAPTSTNNSHNLQQPQSTAPLMQLQYSNATASSTLNSCGTGNRSIYTSSIPSMPTSLSNSISTKNCTSAGAVVNTNVPGSFLTSNNTTSTSSSMPNTMAFHGHPHGQAQVGISMQSTPQNPFILSLNDCWRMPFGPTSTTSSGGTTLDHQSHSQSQRHFGASLNQRTHGIRPDSFGMPINSHLAHHTGVNDPRFHSFYSQNQ